MILRDKNWNEHRFKKIKKTISEIDSIMASNFLGFWSILGGEWEGNRSKTKEQRERQINRNKTLQTRAAEKILNPGEAIKRPNIHTSTQFNSIYT